MTSKMRSLREFRNPIGCLILLAALVAAAGCSTAESPAGSGNNMNHVLPSGSSVGGWLVTPSGGDHTSSATLDYIANNGSSGCTQCHGSDLSGGISNVSCFGNPAGCHHGPVSPWFAPPPAIQQHGVSAKKAPGSSGFASCQICHGSNFSGGGANVSCSNNGAACHGAVASPHAPKPWRGSPYTHTNTDASNAPVCAQCHYTGSPNNPAGHPATPAPAGTAPGCFNSTLCHAEGGHAAGWVAVPPAPQPHGTAAKAANGFPDCQTCHGANFSGSGAAVSCLNNAACHGAGVSSPHPPRPWDNAANYTHTNTSTSGSPGNLSVCANCHRNGANLTTFPPPSPPAPAGTAPGCFNGTLCHSGGGAAPHPVPYDNASHYTVTSTTFPGSCGACHDVSAPSTKVGPVCQTCHVADSPLAAANCTSCHASPPNGGAPAGAAYPNIAGAHAAHIALDNTGTPISCNTCHNGLGGLPSTLNHYNNAKTRVPPGNVAFLATYYAKTGQSSFDNSAALNCSNVSCHGGQATPNWQTGTLNVNTQCTSCHAFGPSVGNPQYNSPYSGEHGINTPSFPNAHRTCTNCHNTTALAVNHFTTLADNTMSPAVASATVGGAGTLITTWTPGTGTSGTCNALCHTGDRPW